MKTTNLTLQRINQSKQTGLIRSASICVLLAVIAGFFIG